MPVSHMFHMFTCDTVWSIPTILLFMLLLLLLRPDIKAGWGMTFDPDNFTLLRAVKPCPANT